MKWIFGVAGLPFTGNTLQTKSLGGSETAALQLARALAKQGEKVAVFTNLDAPPGIYDGVIYQPIQMLFNYLTFNSPDVYVGQRAPELFSKLTQAKLRWIWCHDLALKRMAPAMTGVFWNMDKMLVLSEFMKKQYQEVYDPPPDLLDITRNGLDLSYFPQTNPLEKREKAFVYTSRPERGMDFLLESVWPEIHKKFPEYKLYLSGYDNRVPQLQPLYQKIAMLTEKQKDSVIVLPPLTKKQLYELYNRCLAYLYPSEFEEISCITAMEAMACGMPLIGSKIGALPETLHPDAGILIDDSIQNRSYIEKFVQAVEQILNPEVWKKMHIAGRNNYQKHNWDDIAKEWIQKAEEQFKERTADRGRMAWHFIWRSDIICADRVLKTRPEGEKPTRAEEEAQKWLQKNYKFYYDNDYINHYNLIAKDTQLPDVEAIQQLDRVKRILKFLKLNNIKRVIDYGCAHGHITTVIAKECPEVEIVGLDICADIEPWFQKMKEKAGAGDNCQIKIFKKSASEEYPELNSWADCVLLQETIEHAPEPWKTITDAEKLCKPGGIMFLSTPFGPWEAESYHSYPHRCHLWEIDEESIEEMLSGKQELNIDTIAGGFSTRDGYPLSWYYVTYRADHVPAKPLNIERKLKYQNPQETLSVCIITKNAENMILRMLKSVHRIANQIVICDTGSTDRTLELVKDYATDIISGSDPLVHGFETPRNESIEKAWGDWILWIDSDEELNGSQNVPKYLRGSKCWSYAIRQHHFSTQPPNVFPPDLPSRIFRNHKGIRFYGMIHEHPEVKMNDGIPHTLLLSDVEIAHDGYLTEEIRRRRFERNIPMMFKDREKYPDRILGKFLMMRDWCHLARYTLERNGGMMTPEIAQYYQNAIKEFRETFLNGHFSKMTIDGLQFYTEATRMLGIGFDAALTINLTMPLFQPADMDIFAERAKQDIKIIRWANADDLQKFTQQLIMVQAEQVQGRYV